MTALHAVYGNLEPMRWMVMSGKPLCFRQLPIPRLIDRHNTEEVACQDLWARLLVNENLVRYDLRLKAASGSPASCTLWPDVRYLDLYATLVFLCDGLLRDPHSLSPPAWEYPTSHWRPEEFWQGQNFRRFFSIARSLPLDLQGLLCLRVGDHPGSVIPTLRAEVAFQHLAHELSLASTSW